VTTHKLGQKLTDYQQEHIYWLATFSSKWIFFRRDLNQGLNGAKQLPTNVRKLNWQPTSRLPRFHYDDHITHCRCLCHHDERIIITITHTSITQSSTHRIFLRNATEVTILLSCFNRQFTIAKISCKYRDKLVHRVVENTARCTNLSLYLQLFP